MVTARKRIDQLLVERGLADSRHRAQALLLAGSVLVNEQKVEKPGQRVQPDAAVRLIGESPYVSRAGAKLEAALSRFGIRVRDRVCIDLGASTGGFTDCLLQHGAREVHAFDVGRGQLAWKLQSDPKVVAHDRFNVRNLAARDLPPHVSLVTADLSFISLTKILKPLKAALLGLGGAVPIDLVLLVKPQFEVGKGLVGKGGIVRQASQRAEAVESVAGSARSLGYEVLDSLPSPVFGSKGNQEFLLYLRLPADLSCA